MIYIQHARGVVYISHHSLVIYIHSHHSHVDVHIIIIIIIIIMVVTVVKLIRVFSYSSWVPDYQHTGRPRVYGREGYGDVELRFPTGVAVCPQTRRLVIADSLNNRIHVVTADLEPVVTFGGRGRGDGLYEYPLGVAVSDAGEIYVTDTYNYRVQVHGPDGTYRRQLGSEGAGPGQFRGPHDVTWCNRHLYVCDSGNNRVSVWAESGRPVRQLSVPDEPLYIATSPDGRQLAVTCYDSGLHLLTADGEAVMTVRGGQGSIEDPAGVCYDTSGHIILADEGAGCVHVLGRDGRAVCRVGTRGRGPGELWEPQGVALTGRGEIVVADQGNHRVHVYPVPGAP